MIDATPRRLAIFGALLVLVAAPAAHATNNGPVFGLRALGNPTRGYFFYNVVPGATHGGAIIVSNTGNRTGTVKLYPADATTGRTTGTVYLTNGRIRRFGAWVKLARRSLTLAPGAHAQVNFTVRVPASAKPGQWVAGVVAEAAARAQGPRVKHKANVRIRIRNLTIVAVQVNVPGTPTFGFKIGPVRTAGQRGYQQVLVHFASTGNQLTKPAGVVRIFASKGRLLETLPFTMDTFLPQTAIDYPMFLTKALPPGHYRAAVRLDIRGVAGGGAGPTRKSVVADAMFTVTRNDVKQAFTSSKQTAPPASDGSGSSARTWALYATGAVGALLLALVVFQLGRRRERSG